MLKNYGNLVFVVVNLLCMRAKFFKKLLGIALAFALVICGCVKNTPKVVYAESSADYINYVSFGDSIATGYGLDGYSADADFIDGSYETLFKTYIANVVTHVNATSYAVDGHTASNLLSILQSNQSARASIQNADVVTVSIGGNDLLGPAKTHIVSCFVEGNYDALKSSMATALTNFETVFADILAEFSAINPNAKIVFTNVFNPYKSLLDAPASQEIKLTATMSNIPIITTTLTGATMNEFGQMTEDYIAGNSSLGIKGMNQIMAEKIATATNCYLADSKTAFDSYAGEYIDVANANLTKQPSITVEAASSAQISAKIFEYLDPHPTALGHQILARELQDEFAQNLAFVTFDYNGATVSNKTDDKSVVLKNKTISAPATNPSIEHYTFDGWFTDLQNETAYDFAQDVTTNLKLYAKWKAITFNVIFNFNGGSAHDLSFAKQEVMEGCTADALVGQDEPTLEKHAFVGWFEDLSSNTPFDFSTPITKDITLYAKWEQTAFDVTFDYGNGTLNDEHSKTIVVDKNQLLTKPAGENMPVYLDHALVGWFKDVELTNEWNFETDTITADTILYAKWERTVWYVTLNYNGGNIAGATSQVVKVAKGDKMLAPSGADIKYTGYVFKYWYEIDSSVAFDFENTVISSDMTLYAFWAYGINVIIVRGDSTPTWKVAKDSTVGELTIPTREGTVFYGWFKDPAFENEFEDDYVLQDGLRLYVKWVTLTCNNEDSLTQNFSPISKNIDWIIDARVGSVVIWQVNGAPVCEPQTVVSSTGAPWEFVPEQFGVGTYTISCIVDGGVVNGKTIQLNYSVPTDLLINLDKVVDKKTYVLEVDNKMYYDESKFVWFKTDGLYSDDFSEEIGRGFVLEYTFASDCKICVKYLSNPSDTVCITSNIVNVSVDNHIDTTTLVAIILTVLVIAIIVIGTVVSYRRNKASV